MRRIPTFIALAVAGLSLGTAAGHAVGHPDATTRLASASAAEPADAPPPTEPVHHERSGSDPAPVQPAVTPEPPHDEPTPPPPPPPPPHDEPTTTTSTTTAPSTTTTAPPAPSGPLTIACTSSAATHGVECRWRGAPKGADRLVLMRERPGSRSEPIWSTDDTADGEHLDATVDDGVTYVYRVSAYDGDRFLETSNPVRVKAGGGDPDPAPAPTVTMSCTTLAPSTVRCQWGNGPAGTVRWRLVRTVDDRRGRVIAEVDGATHAADDHDVPAGQQSYFVQALDATGKVIGVGHGVVDCCTAAD